MGRALRLAGSLLGLCLILSGPVLMLAAPAAPAAATAGEASADLVKKRVENPFFLRILNSVNNKGFFTLVTAGLIPLLIYAVAAMAGRPRAGIWGAMVSSVLLFILMYAMYRSWDFSILMEIVLIVLLGAISLRTNNQIFLKFQPVVVGVAVGVFLLWFQAFDTPYLVQFMPRLEKWFPNFILPVTDLTFNVMLATLSGTLIWIFLIHAGVLTMVCFAGGELLWITTRLAIFPAIVGAIFLVVFRYYPLPS